MKNFSTITTVAGAVLFALGTSFAFATQTTDEKQQQAAASHNKNDLITLTSDSLKWQDGPEGLPAGAQYAILEGNPHTKGPFTIRLKFPANYQIPPHFHAAKDHFTIISGSLNIGSGDKLDTNKGIALPAGSFVIIPANNHHYAWTTEETILQLSDMGPWSIKYVNPTDDPRKHKSEQLQKAIPGHPTNPSTQPATTY
jgi:quercetin dioxygenase-like cupin family protein